MTDRRTARITTTRTANTAAAITAVESLSPVDGTLLSDTCSVGRILSTDGLEGTTSIVVGLSVVTSACVDSTDSDSVDIGTTGLVSVVTGSVGMEGTEVGCGVAVVSLGIDDEVRVADKTLVVVGHGGGVGTI